MMKRLGIRPIGHTPPQFLCFRHAVKLRSTANARLGAGSRNDNRRKKGCLQTPAFAEGVRAHQQRSRTRLATAGPQNVYSPTCSCATSPNGRLQEWMRAHRLEGTPATLVSWTSQSATVANADRTPRFREKLCRTDLNFSRL